MALTFSRNNQDHFMTQILKASIVREKFILELKNRVSELKEKGIVPCMQVILVGQNPASVIYTRNKKKFIESMGGLCDIIKLPESITEGDFKKEVSKIVDSKNVHGCFVQLPLPKQLAHIDVGNLIPTSKDVDGFSIGNIAALFKGDIGNEALLPCTPKGIITLLQFYGINLNGANCVIIGRSEIVGRPMALLLLNHNATVTVCHSKTKDIKKLTKEADIIISAIGRPKFIDESYFNKSKTQIVVDVGMNVDENEKLCGDVDYEAVFDLVGGITPVPGGVGPMTILSLAENLLLAAENTLK